MAPRQPSGWELEKLRALLAAQFDEAVANAFLSLPLQVETRRGKIRYVYVDGRRIMTLRPSDFHFTLSLEAGEVVRSASRPPRYRVVAARIPRPSVMGLDVIDADPDIRPGDEVLIVTAEDRLIGVGKARLPGHLMRLLPHQEAVRAREVAGGAKAEGGAGPEGP